MIVICTKCQAKFRVVDDKIGPRGAKVRCSRCKEIFVVHRESAAAAAPEPAPAPPPARPLPPGLDLEPRTGDPFAIPPAPPAAAAGDPFSIPPPAPAPASGEADPFAAFAAPPPVAPPPDPFGADPFAAAPSHADPFAAMAPPPVPDPFAAPSPAPGVRASLPVTDLADVLGAAAALPAAAPPAAKPAEDPFRAPPPPFPELEPPSVPFPDLTAPAPAPPPPGGVPADPFAAAFASPSAAGDLALEERTTPPPRSLTPAPAPAAAPDAALDVGSIDPFAAAAAAPPVPFDPGAFDGAALGGAGESLDVEAPAAAPPGAAPAAPPRLPPPALPAAQPAAQPAAPVAAAAWEEAPRPRGTRVRSVAVNAVALAALLLVTLAIWVVWHAEGPLEAGSLRPSAILAALRRGGPASEGPWAAQDVGSGVYERDRGPPLLFVRGRVLSRAAAPAAAVRVKVEVVRGAAVIASGDALAGAVPTAEELYGAGDPAALTRVVAAARARAPAEVRPGDSVPFLVALGDAPANLDGAAVRLAVSPVERPAAASPGAAPVGSAPPGAAPPAPAAAAPGGAAR